MECGRDVDWSCMTRRSLAVVPVRPPHGLYFFLLSLLLNAHVHRLRFGKMVDKVIPYLPMDLQSNLLVLELKLRRLGETLPGGLYTTSGELLLGASGGG